MNPPAKKKSPYERYTGKEPNTIKRIVTNTDRAISEPPKLKQDFESGQDSTVLVRERANGTKMEGDFKKRKGVLMEQSNHTITFPPAGRSQTTIISKRDIENWDQQPSCSKQLINKEGPEAKQQTKPREMPEPAELTTPEETTIPEELTNQQSAAKINEPTNQSQ